MSEKKTKRRINPVFLVILCALLSLFCGIGGGWFAITHMQTEPTVIFQNTQTDSPSPTTTSVDGSISTIADATNKAAPSVVEILIEGETIYGGIFGGAYESSAAGSGVIISSKGYIITNDHVVENASKITVTTYDGKVYDATLIGKDTVSDIGVIKIEEDDTLTPAVLGDSSKVRAGDTAIVIGNPLGTLGGTVTDGIISATSRELTVNGQSMDLIQTNAEINSGNSGGGLFDGNGNLIGIVNAKDSGTTSSGTTIEGIGFAIPINYAMEVAEDIIENGKVTNRATIGVYLQELTSNSGNYPAGLYVTDTIQGSAAEEAGIKAYDRIIAIDDTDVSSYTDLSRYLRGKNIGDEVTLHIIRNNKEMSFLIKLTGTLEH